MIRPCHREDGRPKIAYRREVDAALVAAQLNAEMTGEQRAQRGGQPIHHYPCEHHGWHVGTVPRTFQVERYTAAAVDMLPPSVVERMASALTEGHRYVDTLAAWATSVAGPALDAYMAATAAAGAFDDDRCRQRVWVRLGEATGAADLLTLYQRAWRLVARDGESRLRRLVTEGAAMVDA